jgi:hypothetical protein
VVTALVSIGAGFAASGLLVWRAPSSVLRRRKTIRLIVRAVAVAAAVGGALAGPSATGLDVLDVVFRAGLCAGAVLLAGSANRWLLVGAAALALAGTWSSATWSLAPWLAGAGLGLALGPAAAHLKAPAIKAAAAGLITQAALRLSWPGTERGTALLALVIFAVLVLGGFSRAPAGLRRQVVKGARIAAAAGAAASLLGVLAVVFARAGVENGIRSATAGVSSARDADPARSTALFGQADRSFSGARRHLDSWWSKPAWAVPLVSQQLRVLRDVTASGATTSRAGGRVAQVVNRQELRLSGGAVPIEQIAALEAPARDAFSVLTSAQARIGSARSPWLLPPVSSRLTELEDRLGEAREGAQVTLAAAELAPPLLGAKGPRRYFLAIQTPSELRGSGGFIGNFGEISVDRGRLGLDRLGRTRDLNRGGDPASRRVIAPPDYLGRYQGFFDPNSVWQNLTMSPDFPTVGRVIADLYPQSGGRPVDGVISIDPIGLAGLLKVLGPVRVPAWPVPITADNAARVLLHDQYVQLDGDAREDFLADVTSAVWQRLTAGRANAVSLVRALAPVAAEKHLLFVSTRPEEQQALRRLGTAGALPPVQGDFLGLVTQNAGANKIDWFLRRSVDYDAKLDPASGEVRATVRVGLRNMAPAGGLPPYVIGSGTKPPLPLGTNKMYLSLYSPLFFTAARVNGQPLALESEIEQGRNVYSAYVTVPAGGSSTVEIDLTGEIDVSDGYRLDVFHQPFLAPETVSASVQVADGWAVGQGGDSRSQSERQELTRNWSWRLPVSAG